MCPIFQVNVGALLPAPAQQLHADEGSESTRVHAREDSSWETRLRLLLVRFAAEIILVASRLVGTNSMEAKGYIACQTPDRGWVRLANAADTSA